MGKPPPTAETVTAADPLTIFPACHDLVEAGFRGSISVNGILQFTISLSHLFGNHPCN